MLLVSGLEIRVPGFIPRQINVGFVVDKVALLQVFFPSIWKLLYQYNSTETPYHN